jgi:hypothetical protein
MLIVELVEARRTRTVIRDSHLRNSQLSFLPYCSVLYNKTANDDEDFYFLLGISKQAIELGLHLISGFCKHI